MGSSLNDMMVDSRDNFIYTDSYLTFMASHFKYIREHNSTQMMPLDKTVIHKNLNDFFGYFTDIGVRYRDQQLLLMLNGFSSHLDLTEDVESIFLPSNEMIDTLQQMYKTTLT